MIHCIVVNCIYMFFASTIFNEKICIIQISQSILALQELEEIIFVQNVKSIKGEYIYTHFPY